MPILENSLCNIENKVKLEKEQQNKEKQRMEIIKSINQ